VAAGAAVSLAELAQLFTHFLSLSLLAVGGAITVAPEMHRYVVVEQGWLGDEQFTASIALAQSAPGPNVLFVTLVGWNAGGWAGALAATLGIMLPSATLALYAFRWTQRRHQLPWVRAFRVGMAPITIGLLLATGWILAAQNVANPLLVVVSVATIAMLVKTRINPLWLIAAGAAAGIAIGA
jgi:chromate transporter